MVGVAYRGHIALEDIQVDFEVEPVELPQSIGFGVREAHPDPSWSGGGSRGQLDILWGC